MSPRRLRLPTRASLAGLPGFVRERAALLGYATFTLAVFLLALLWTLPHDLIATRAVETALAAAPVRIVFQRVAFAFPNGYRFDEVRVTPVGETAPAATLSELTVRLPLTALLIADFRRAAFSGNAYGGDFAGSVALDGERVAGRLDADGIRLAPALAPLVPPPGKVSGAASLSLQLAGDGRTTQSSQGEVRLQISDLALEGVSVSGITVPDLSFATVAGEAQVFGSRVQLKELRAEGRDVNLSATGDVLLRDQLPQSVLNLRLTIDVPPNAQPALRMAASLLPKRNPGESPAYTLRGTIASPVLR